MYTCLVPISSLIRHSHPCFYQVKITNAFFCIQNIKVSVWRSFRLRFTNCLTLKAVLLRDAECNIAAKQIHQRQEIAHYLLRRDTVISKVESEIQDDFESCLHWCLQWSQSEWIFQRKKWEWFSSCEFIKIEFSVDKLLCFSARNKERERRVLGLSFQTNIRSFVFLHFYSCTFTNFVAVCLDFKFKTWFELRAISASVDDLKVFSFSMQWPSQWVLQLLIKTTALQYLPSRKELFRLFKPDKISMKEKRCFFQSKGIFSVVELEYAETLCSIGVLNITTDCLSFKWAWALSIIYLQCPQNLLKLGAT